MNKFPGNKFEDIYDFAKKLTKKEKGDLFEELTYHLFKLDPRLNNNLQNIWLYKDIPNKILTELNWPDKDKGVDLLAKINNEYYAIQCKFRQNPNVTVSWTSLSTFFGLSFGLNDKIAGGFLVTNTYDLCDEVIKSTLVEPIYGDFFDSLPKNFFECIRNNNTKIKYVTKKPFQHQRACILNSEFHYVDFDRGHIEMACGSGKTLNAYWINSRLFNKRTVIFVPSLYLLSQFYSDWINQSFAENKQIKYLLVGSDADVDEEIKYKSNGLFLYTDPKLIRKYIKNINDKLVVICTYQSSDKLAEACKNIEFDFGFFDETHKTVGQVNKKFTIMLTDKYLFIKKRLFMTATPKIYSGDLDNDEVISMDNKKIYGDKIFTYNTGQAITDKRLVDYQVLTVYAKNKDIEKDIKKNKLVKFKDEFADEEANYLGIILVLLKKFHDGTCKHLITYHNKVKRAVKFKDFLVKINELLYDEEIFVESLDGSTSMGRRTKIIKEFIGSPKGILCSARVLNEGVNIPIVDSICFVDPRFSTIDIVQCIGRALRLHLGKELAHIIVPTFINNFDDDFNKNVYGNVIRILKALKTTDDGVIEYFKLRANGKVDKRAICAGEYYNTNIDISKEIDLDKWNGGIETKVWQVVDRFEYMYDKVMKWASDHGKLPSSMSKNKIEKELGSFCHHRRFDRRNGKLSGYKYQKLEKIPYWYWLPKNIKKLNSFKESYCELKKWITINNRFPSRYSIDKIEKKLGGFCAKMREKKINGKLYSNEIIKLEKIPYWYWKKEDPFYNIYDQVKNWTNQYNKLPVNNNNNNTIEKKFAQWCNKKKKDKRNGILDEDKIKKLEQLVDWYWDKEDVFDVTYNNVKKWIKITKKIPSNKSKDELERKMGNWCQKQRCYKRKNKLDKEKIIKLEKINEWFWGQEQIKQIKTFEDRYNELKKFVNVQDKLPSVNSKELFESSIGKWCHHQRENYIKNKLDHDKIKNLEKIPNWYWDKKNQFYDKYEQLKKWILIHNKIPSHGSKNQIEKILGKFCQHKREDHKKNKLSKEKITQLETLSGWYWTKDTKKKLPNKSKQYFGSKTSKPKKNII
jgi:superfamily II DNA or RNA helicase